MQTVVVDFRASSPPQSLSLFDPLVTTDLDLSTQFKILCSLPNHHKWNWQEPTHRYVHTKFEQRFSTSMRYYPGSPRNRLINVIAEPRELSNETILRVLKSILGICPDTTTSIKRVSRSLSRLTNRKKSHRPAFNEEDVCSFLGITLEEATVVAENTISNLGTSLYSYFTSELISNGVVSWRLKTDALQVIVMNKYHSEKGDFKVNKELINGLTRVK